MYYACPKCKREFGEGGFCPYDGSSLAQTAAQTVEEFNPAQGHGTDDLATRPHLKSETLSGSAVASVLQGVLEERRSGNEDAGSAGSLINVDLDGRYRIEKLIGEGGMGMVYLARHIVIEKKVAIKVLRAEVAADEAVAKRFVQEARAASRIGHPNIVDVTDFGTTESGLTYQVMEYLEGQTLTDLIRSEFPLPIARALGVIAQMCRALGAAHDKGIVHRDLKPDNIFLVKRDGREDFVKIVDFGIAKVPPRGDANEARLTEVGTVFGTPEYMSPEQASGRTDVDLRADIYAVGIILYEMLVGEVPHKGETTVRTLAMQILDDPKPPRQARPSLDVSEDLEGVVMRALDKKREKRFQSMQELLDALEEATSKTELDLPLVLKQERISANLVRQEQQSPDSGPSIDSSTQPSDSSEITSVRDVERSGRGTGSTRARRGSRVTDPAFLRQDNSASVPIFDPIEPEETDAIPRSKGRLGLVVLVLLVVSSFVFAFVLLRGDSEEPVVAGSEIDASRRLIDAPSSDAAVPGESVDAAEPTLSDAAVVNDHRATKDPKGPQLDSKTPSNRAPNKSVPKGEMLVTVITRPRGARLIIGNAYAGPGGTNIQRKIGAEEVVTCRLDGYIDGTVTVKFDGKNEVFLCKLKKRRTKRCVKGMKNPFDDCPK